MKKKENKYIKFKKFLDENDLNDIKILLVSHEHPEYSCDMIYLLPAGYIDTYEDENADSINSEELKLKYEKISGYQEEYFFGDDDFVDYLYGLDDYALKEKLEEVGIKVSEMADVSEDGDH